MTIGTALKRFRTERGITQKAFAEIIGIDRRLYQHYEYDNVVPATSVVIKIADIFNTSIDYLVGRTRNAESF